MRHTRQQQGFTLIELAIALTIIALLIGGVLAGSNLLRSTKLKSIATEVAKYTQATNNFREKYLALPGDFSGATELWGEANAVLATCIVTASVDSKTCNGDGDGRISTQPVAATDADQYEQYRAWQHLANAGFLEGRFSGVATAVGPRGTGPGVNIPPAAIDGAGYNMTSLTLAESASFAHYFQLNYRNMLQFGSSNTATGQPLAPVLDVDEALSIDTKMDDGLPGSGKIIGPAQGGPFAPNCTTTNDPDTSRYDIAQAGRQCSLLFLLDL